MGKIIFVTGTDTGVGKTLLTALLLVHLRTSGRHAFAMKPFCSGGSNDVRLLSRAQGHELLRDEINPYQFAAPVAPLVAARQARIAVRLDDALKRIQALAARCDALLVEGAGGLLVPLGERYLVADLIEALPCAVIVAVRNRLGAVNHTLLTLAELRRRGVPEIRTVLMQGSRLSLAAQTNPALIGEFGGSTRVFTIPYLGRNPGTLTSLQRHARQLKKTLAHILQLDTFSSAFPRKIANRTAKKGSCDPRAGG